MRLQAQGCVKGDVAGRRPIDPFDFAPVLNSADFYNKRSYLCGGERSIATDDLLGSLTSFKRKATVAR